MNKKNTFKQRFAEAYLYKYSDDRPLLKVLFATAITSAFLVPTGALLEEQPSDIGGDNRAMSVETFSSTANELIAIHAEIQDRMTDHNLNSVRALTDASIYDNDDTVVTNDFESSISKISEFYDLLVRDADMAETDKANILELVMEETDTHLKYDNSGDIAEINPAYIDECSIEQPENFVVHCTEKASDDYNYSIGVAINLMILLGAGKIATHRPRLEKWAKKPNNY